ncbi:MAG: hypothetical protein H7Z10_07445 [Gemmatimonadaceae bacterium]|nr:hypothetical protein [Acetobacteraceae bacterium]
MIPLPPVISYLPRTWLVLLLLVAGCGGLPRYNAALPVLPPAVLQADDEFVMPDGARLPMRTWLPAGIVPRAMVLALHGFNDSRDAWALPYDPNNR